MSGWTQDLRQSLRLIALHPGFSAIVVITLALGIGASTAIFSLVEQVLLRPLPFPDPERLVKIWEVDPASGQDRMWASPDNFLDWRRQSGDAFRDIAAYQDGINVNLSDAGQPERVQASAVSGSFFSVLGVPALSGRTILPQDQDAGERVVVLSDGLWKRRYGADPGVVGKPLRISGNSYLVLGVMPPHFRFPADSELWVLLSGERWKQGRDAHFLDVVGRLRPATSVEQSQRAMDLVATRLAAQYPETNRGWGITVLPLHRELVGNVRPALLVLLGAVVLVLLIACANVANLKLARSAAREPEIAVRVALGASRPRLFRQLLVESVMLSGIAGIAGLLLAVAGLRALEALSPVEIPHHEETALDLRLLAIAILVSLLTGLLFGLIPALQGSRPGLETLRMGRSGGVGGPSGRRWRNVLVIVEVCLSLVLLIGAGLLIRSFLRLTAVDPGFDARNALIVRMALPSAKYSELPQVTAFYRNLLDRLRRIPRVQAVGASNALPVTDEAQGTSFAIEGRSDLPSEQLLANFIQVTPGYFESLGASLVAGRDFDGRDRQGSPPVVIVNQALARQFWPGGQAPGKRIEIDLGEPKWYEIIGVVNDIREQGLDVEQRPAFYLSTEQHPYRTMAILLRTDSDPLALTPSVRQAVLELDRELPLFGIQTLEEHVAKAASRQRFSMLLVGLFATVALILAALGIYSVMAYMVARRSHEIGIRMALGARPIEIVKLVVVQGLVLAALGVTAGLLAAFGLTRTLSGLLFGVAATDLATFVAVPLLLLLVALAAAYLPAQRATRLSPSIALKTE